MITPKCNHDSWTRTGACCQEPAGVTPTWSDRLLRSQPAKARTGWQVHHQVRQQLQTHSSTALRTNVIKPSFHCLSFFLAFVKLTASRCPHVSAYYCQQAAHACLMLLQEISPTLLRLLLGILTAGVVAATAAVEGRCYSGCWLRISVSALFLVICNTVAPDITAKDSRQRTTAELRVSKV